MKYPSKIIPTIRTTASRYSVTLPDEVATAIAALDATEMPAPPNRREVVRHVAAAIGNEKEFHKRLRDAEAALSHYDEALHRDVVKAAAARVEGIIHSSADAIVDAFRPAIEPFVETLNNKALVLPRDITRHKAVDADIETMVRFREAEGAFAAIREFAETVKGLYGASVGTYGAEFPALLVTPVPEFDSAYAAEDFRRALLGKSGGENVGMTRMKEHSDGFPPAMVARFGVTEFILADRTEYRERVAMLNDARTPRRRDDAKTPTAL